MASWTPAAHSSSSSPGRSSGRRSNSSSRSGAVTAVNRSLEGVKLDWLHDQAYTGGLEVWHKFWDDNWGADLRLATSWVHGAPEALRLKIKELVAEYADSGPPVADHAAPPQARLPQRSTEQSTIAES